MKEELEGEAEQEAEQEEGEGVEGVLDESPLDLYPWARDPRVGPILPSECPQ